MQSLTNSAQLIADYLAGKIEQSQPIQTLFQEILVLFQQEAICIGPAFRNTAEESSKVSLKGGSQEKSDQKRTRRTQKDSNNKNIRHKLSNTNSKMLSLIIILNIISNINIELPTKGCS